MIRICHRLANAKDLRKCAAVIRSRSYTDKADDHDKEYVPGGSEYR